MLQLSLIMYFRHKLFSQLYFAINVFFISFDRQKIYEKLRNGPYFVKKRKIEHWKKKEISNYNHIIKGEYRETIFLY